METSKSSGYWVDNNTRLDQLKFIQTKFSSKILIKDPRLSNTVPKVTAKEF